MNIRIDIIRTKDYETIFGISHATAVKYHKQDKKSLKKAKITLDDLKRVYGVTDDQLGARNV